MSMEENTDFKIGILRDKDDIVCLEKLCVCVRDRSDVWSECLRLSTSVCRLISTERNCSPNII